MNGVLCQCGRYAEFIVLPTGSLIESCGCGKRRALRGRTVEDIAREEAAYEATITSAFPQYERGRPCAWPQGCEGFSARRSTDYCPAHCEERRRIKNRDTMRLRLRDLRDKRRTETISRTANV